MDSLLQILNHLFLLPNVCNQIIFDYWKLIITFDQTIEMYHCYFGINIFNDNLFFHYLSRVIMMNLITKQRHSVKKNCKNSKFVKSNDMPPLIFIDNQLINLVTTKQIHTYKYIKNNLRDNIDEYHYNQYYYYVQRSFQIEKYSNNNILQSVFKFPEKEMDDIVIDMMNDDVYCMINGNIVKIPWKCNYRRQYFKYNQESSPDIRAYCIHDEELYIIIHEGSCSRLVICNKNTFDVLSDNTIINDIPFPTCNIAVNVTHIAVQIDEMTYIYTKY